MKTNETSISFASFSDEELTNYPDKQAEKIAKLSGRVRSLKAIVDKQSDIISSQNIRIIELTELLKTKSREWLYFEKLKELIVKDAKLTSQIKR